MAAPLARVRRAVALAVCALAVPVLAGCSDGAAEGAGPAPETASPSAAPSATAGSLPEPEEDPLFSVASRARAVDGTTIDLVLRGFRPLASTSSDAEPLVADFLGTCTELGGLSISEPGTPVDESTLAAYGSSLMRVDYSATPEGQRLVAPVNVIVGIDNLPTIANGPGVQLLQTSDTCLARYQLAESGAGSFVADFETGEAAPDPGQWRFGNYGFTVTVESGATLESCEIEVSAQADAEVADVPGWDAREGTALSCGIGYTGE